MATFSEIVYMCLDELKRNADDSFYTEEHVAFLAVRARAYLLETKYAKTNEPIDDDNYQTVCLSLEKSQPLGTPSCGAVYLRSVKKLPQTLSMCCVRVYPEDYFTSETFSFTSAERLRFAGEGRFLKNMSYAAQGTDGHLWLKSSNPQLGYLDRVRVSAVFTDPKEALEASCDESDMKCDWLDAEFPMEETLTSLLVQTVVKELQSVSFMPSDKVNDSSDNLNEMYGLYGSKSRKKKASDAS